MAGSDAEAGGEPDDSWPMERRAKDVHAQALGQHHRVGCAAARQKDQEFIVAGPAQDIVAAQQAGGSILDSAQQPFAGRRAQPGLPVAKSSMARRRQAQWSLHALGAVGLTKKKESRLERLHACEWSCGFRLGGFSCIVLELSRVIVARSAGQCEAEASNAGFADSTRDDVVEDIPHAPMRSTPRSGRPTRGQ